MPRPVVVVLAAVLAVTLAACGGGDQAEQAAQEGAQVVADGAAGVQVSGGPDEKPSIDVPDGRPPAELVVQDLIEGDGAEAAENATVTTHYVGVSWSTGEEFDSSWGRGQPATFPLNQVIPGWTQGIPGMKVGGRRLLVIPPDLAYGDSPPPGAAIAPGETLVFVIDLVDVS